MRDDTPLPPGTVSGLTPQGTTSVPEMCRPLMIGRSRPGRKPVMIDLEVVERLASIFATVDEIATALGVSRATFMARKSASKEIKEAVLRGRRAGRMTLRRRLFERSLHSDKILMYLGEHYLGLKKTMTIEGGKLPVKHQVAIPEDERLGRISKLADVVLSDETIAPTVKAKLQGMLDAARGPAK